MKADHCHEDIPYMVMCWGLQPAGLAQWNMQHTEKESYDTFSLNLLPFKTQAF